MANHKKIQMRYLGPGHHVVCQYPIPAATVAMAITFERASSVHTDKNYAANPFRFSYHVSKNLQSWRQLEWFEHPGGMELVEHPFTGRAEEARRCGVVIPPDMMLPAGSSIRVLVHNFNGGNVVEGDVWFLDRWSSDIERTARGMGFGDKPTFTKKTA
jgi:hypothetical protein